MYSGILGQSFFLVIKKIWWHRWHSSQNRLEVLVLANNRCATTLISVGTAWHKWCIYWLFCNYGLAQMYSARATLFVFLKTFLPKNLTIHWHTPYLCTNLTTLVPFLIILRTPLPCISNLAYGAHCLRIMFNSKIRFDHCLGLMFVPTILTFFIIYTQFTF